MLCTHRPPTQANHFRLFFRFPLEGRVLYRTERMTSGTGMKYLPVYEELYIITHTRKYDTYWYVLGTKHTWYPSCVNKKGMFGLVSRSRVLRCSCNRVRSLLYNILYSQNLWLKVGFEPSGIRTCIAGWGELPLRTTIIRVLQALIYGIFSDFRSPQIRTIYYGTENHPYSCSQFLEGKKKSKISQSWRQLWAVSAASRNWNLHEMCVLVPGTIRLRTPSIV